VYVLASSPVGEAGPGDGAGAGTAAGLAAGAGAEGGVAGVVVFELSVLPPEEGSPEPSAHALTGKEKAKIRMEIIYVMRFLIMTFSLPV
jgi:hypothetical protein